MMEVLHVHAALCVNEESIKTIFCSLLLNYTVVQLL